MNLKLLSNAFVYVKDGVLLKYRFDNNNPLHIDAILNKKVYSKEKVTDREYEYIKTMGNVVIEEGTERAMLNFSNFSRSY